MIDRGDICPYRATFPNTRSYGDEYRGIAERCIYFWDTKHTTISNGECLDCYVRHLIPGRPDSTRPISGTGFARVLFLGKDYDSINPLLGLQLKSFAPADLCSCPVIIRLDQPRRLTYSFSGEAPDRVLPALEVSKVLDDPTARTLRELVKELEKPGDVSLIQLSLDNKDLLLNPRECMRGVVEIALVDQMFASDITSREGKSSPERTFEAAKRLELSLCDNSSRLIDYDFVVLASEDNWLHLMMLELIKEETTYLQERGMDQALINGVVRSKFLVLGETGFNESPHIRDKAFSGIESVCSTLGRVDMDAPLLSAARVVIRFNALVSYLIKHPGDDKNRSIELMQRAVSAINVILDGQISSGTHATIGSL